MAGGHALEFLKIDKQVTNLPYREIIRKMTAQKGLAGTLDGFFPWGCLQSTLKVRVCRHGCGYVSASRAARWWVGGAGLWDAAESSR